MSYYIGAQGLKKITCGDTHVEVEGNIREEILFSKGNLSQKGLVITVSQFSDRFPFLQEKTDGENRDALWIRTNKCTCDVLV